MLRLAALIALLLKLSPLANASVEYAENFTISQQNGYSLITVNNGQLHNKPVHRYALISKSAPIPKELPEDITLIRTPVARIVAMETVHLGYIAELDSIHSLIGAASSNYITNPEISAKLETDEIKTVQSGQALDIERLLLLQPDLILKSASSASTLDAPSQLLRLELPVTLTTSYLETSPLARAEWIKFIAAFIEKEREAEEIFKKIKQRYKALTELTKRIPSSKRPTVFCDAPYSGTWHIPGGDSYTAQLISNAGGRYPWANTRKRASIPLDIERVFLKAAQADYWINPSHYRSLKNLKSMDPRFELFQAVKNATVYNNTLQVKQNGGNPIWESGVCRPDEILADLISIFHPNLIPEHNFVFYEQLK